MSKLNGALETEKEPETSGEEGTGAVVRAVIAGATGYAGRELITILSRHPRVRVTRLMSSGRSDQQPFAIEQSHPVLRAASTLACEPLRLEDFNRTDADVVFLATPHHVSLQLVPSLLERSLRVIDLSGAFRLKDASLYPRWYAFAHNAPSSLAEAVYGLTELNRAAVASARLVANPGCYATSVILGLAPLLQAGWVDANSEVICDAKSGVTGAGRAPSEELHFSEVNENFRAYALFNHRHVPEMLQALKLDARRFTFTPHLLPLNRGILSTIYLRLKGSAKTLADVEKLFKDFYAHAPMVRVYEPGSLPEIQAVAHLQYADLGFALDEPTGRLIVLSALDNLGKGAAGQAVQNMNLMFGFAEETALL